MNNRQLINYITDYFINFLPNQNKFYQHIIHVPFKSLEVNDIKNFKFNYD